VLLVHSEIYYVPIGDGWTEVLVRNVIRWYHGSCYLDLERSTWVLICKEKGKF
jgi:hypothetical protein